MTTGMREIRARRRAHKLGLHIAKSRSRTLDDPGYGGYMVVDSAANAAIFGCDSFAYSADLNDVEQFLSDLQTSASTASAAGVM